MKQVVHQSYLNEEGEWNKSLRTYLTIMNISKKLKVNALVYEFILWMALIKGAISVRLRVLRMKVTSS